MSDTIVADARPRSDFSSPAFHRESVRIQHQYATLAGAGVLTKEKLIKALSTLPEYIYWSDAPLTDRYVPNAIVYLKVARGKIAIVFPRCFDEACQDGTITDRALTIHFIADVTVQEMVAVTERVLTALANIPLRDFGDEQFEPCGLARLG